MIHPLDFIPDRARKPAFLVFLIGTLGLFAVFQALNAPLVTAAAPSGIVTFELAGTPERALEVLSSWDPRYNLASSLLVTDIREPPLYAALGLGLDYLFMPVYALALAFGTLLAAGRHQGWLKAIGALAGWGALVAALFDAVENIALWRILLGDFFTSWPSVAAICAYIKFSLIALGMTYAIVAGLVPKKRP